MLANLASYIAYVPSADTFSAAATTVGALDRLLALRDRGICARAQALDTLKLHVAVTALRGSRQLLQVQVTVLTVRRLHNAPTVRPRVVGVTLAQSKTLSHLFRLVRVHASQHLDREDACVLKRITEAAQRNANLM